MTEAEPIPRRRLWLAAAISISGLAIAILWIVAISGPEICGWGGPTLCFRPPRVQLAGIATASIVGAVVLLALFSLLTARRPGPFRWACGAVMGVTAVGTAVCVSAMV